MLSLKQGQTLSLACVATKQDNTPQSLDGFTVKARLRLKDTAAAVVRYQVGSGLVITDSAAGEFRIDMNTAGLALGTYEFDIRYSNGVRTEYSPTEIISITTGELQ